jgi:hypothetical protein
MPDPGLKFGIFFSRPVLKFPVLAFVRTVGYLHRLSFTIFILKLKIILELFLNYFRIIKHNVRGGKVGEDGLFILRTKCPLGTI